MKTILTLLLFFFGHSFFAQDVYVRGYYRDNGTYVAPHYRTAPNSTVNDNYSTIGNMNPYTGEAGTKPREAYTSNPIYTPPSTYNLPASNPTQYHSYPAKEIANLEIPIDEKTKAIVEQFEREIAEGEYYNEPDMVMTNLNEEPLIINSTQTPTFDDFKDDRVAFKDYNYTAPTPTEQPQNETNENSSFSQYGVIFMCCLAALFLFTNRR